MKNTEPATISSDNPLVSGFYDNTQSNVIRITEANLRVILMENEQSLTKSKDFLTSLTLICSLLLTYVTADFKPWAGLDAATWRGFYLFVFVFSIGWLIRTLLNFRRAISIDELISKIRKEESILQAQGVILNSNKIFNGGDVIVNDSAVEAKGLVSRTLFKPTRKAPIEAGPTTIQIISATYGGKGGQEDVTIQIRNAMATGDSVVSASNDFFSVDPAPGRPKQLSIHYRLNGQEVSLVVKEGESRDLSAPYKSSK